MGRKLYLPAVIFILSIVAASAQTGEIRGKVTEKGGKEIPFASVAALVNGVQVQATIADFEGNYSIKPLNPAKYDVKATAVGYQSIIKSGVIVSTDNSSYADLELSKGIEMKVIEIIEYKEPLINNRDPIAKKTLTFEEIQALPTRDVNSAAVQSVGVYQKEEGGALNIRGSRSEGTSYYVDGIKVTGSSPGIAQRGTEQITVITGGIPAQYGDATGGVISVTTRGPSNEFGGGVEAATSEVLDNFGYNLVSANFTGPIYTPKDADGKKTGQSMAGFFFAGEYQYDKDPDPSVIPIYTVKDDILSDVEKNPLVRAPSNSSDPLARATFIHRSSYFTNDSVQAKDYHDNVEASNIRMNGKIDIRPVKNLTITLGGTYERGRANQYSHIYSLMNFSNNSEQIITNWRTFAKFTQRFGSEEGEKSNSVIKNAYYTVQVDYSSRTQEDQDERHKKNYFDYGYVGKFNTTYLPFIQQVANPNSNDTDLYVQTGNIPVQCDFTPGTLNPNTTSYTTQYYALTNPFGTFGYTDDITNVEGGGGLINGDNRTGLNVYGLWGTTGRIPNGYQIATTTQGRISASGSADIKNHNIVVGIEYEQRTQRGYFVSTSSLWTLMRQLGNRSLTGIDTLSAQTSYVMVNGRPGQLVTYNHGNYEPFKNTDNEPTRGFYENFRDRVGVSLNDTVQTDSYDLYDGSGNSTGIYSLDLFSPDELLNIGSGSLIDYYGYDYKGEKETSSSWDLKDFYVNKDKNNNFLRKIDAFRPVYMAGYIQDNFKYNDINFNIGVRIDRFDANQKVLKDMYSLYELHTAGEQVVADLAAGPNGQGKIPDNIGDNYAVYVNNAQSPTKVVGYRNGSTWYDENGTVITKLDPLLQNGEIQPYLTNYSDYQNNRVNPNAFADYTPQVTVMPRIAFSFPISDEAGFSAHYDVLTERPQNSNLLRFSPIDYLNWSKKIGGNFANPNLKPDRTTVYEINFQQKLSRSSAFSISAFYKDIKDNIQFINVDYAFPIKYTTYGNIDFGTVKGLTFGYDLRRTNNIRMNVSYTLQFAEGTGSSATTNSGILSQQGQTNLREVKPLDFDQRHTLVASIDYHYGEGKDYDGPVWFNKQFFANSGINLVFHAGSGSPYTRKANVTPEADFTTTANSRSVISGSINGSRYPWNFRIDLKLDKDFALKTGTDEEGKAKKSIYLNVYLQVLNVLNTTNVTTVYAATGSPSDDGYIGSPDAASVIARQPSPEAYTDLYSMKVNDPAHYDLPRRIRLGLQVNF